MAGLQVRHGGVTGTLSGLPWYAVASIVVCPSCFERPLRRGLEDALEKEAEFMAKSHPARSSGHKY